MSKSHLVVLGFAGALLAWFFGPALVGTSGFVFRDAAHYYHPLFQFIRQEWGSLRLPLWNPYENLGVPLVGENTSSVFYPGKLIFLLPLDYTLLYNWYIVAHVALSAATSFRLARHWGASVMAAGLAAISFAFSGNVLFGYCNVVFLVGAAWLPLAVLLADRTLTERTLRPSIQLGIVLALMVLGGDPQMAYNVGLLAALYATLLWRAKRRDLSPSSDSTNNRSILRPAAFLAISGIVCLLLSAVQILPSLETSRLSARGSYDSPRNIYELGAFLATGRAGAAGHEKPTPWYTGLLNSSAQGHQRQVYPFSIGPWRAIEYVWPNISGRQFPTNRRWLSALPAEGRVWVPSFYMGLLPMLLAAISFSVRRRAPVQIRWLSWIVLLSALASLGSHGVVWMLREIDTWWGGDDQLGVGDEVGGLYWLMTVVLPGYVYLRYPAKLLVLTSLGLSMLAARGWDDESPRTERRLRRLLWAIIVVSLFALIVVIGFWPSWRAMLESIPADPLFGPFNANGARRDIIGGLSQTAALAAVLLAILWCRSMASMRALVGPVLLAITSLDLAIAQHWLIPYAPADAWRMEPEVVKALKDGAGDYRVYRDPNLQPESWRRTSSEDRQIEGLRWDRETLLPKYHLPYRVPMVEASGTMVPFDFAMLLDVAREHAEPANNANAGESQPHGSILELLGAGFAIVPDTSAPAASEGVKVVRRATALPRAWIVHHLEVIPELASRAPGELRQRTEQVLFPGGQPRDWREVAVVEIGEPLPMALTIRPPSADDRCRITHSDPQRVEIDAHLVTPGLLVLSDLHFPGWELSVETAGRPRAEPILRTNRVMRGVLLPAGDHRLVFQYRPGSVYLGGAISLVTVVGVSIVALIQRRRERRNSGNSPLPFTQI